jgi:hypothetical protein
MSGELNAIKDLYENKNNSTKDVSGLCPTSEEQTKETLV